MDTQKTGVGVLVLTSRETQAWHSPLSAELRRWRRERIVHRCRRRASAAGLRAFALYDALENRLLQEILAE